MLKVSDIMTTDVIIISSFATVAQAVKLMEEQGVLSLIVNRRHPQDAYGIITETDIINKVVAYGKDPKTIRVYEIMTKPCIVVNPDLAVEYAARLFMNTGIRCAPVIQNELLGIISATDILTKSDFIENPKQGFWSQEIERYVTEARSLCQALGHDSEPCKNAWKLVEAIQAEAAHQTGEKPEKTALEEYLEEYPEAKETLILENWCSG
ncbi:CBS domain containing protein [Rippkaea orientalis PCC 8801]|uniref:CBS domain containing protein n=1 Tax=Rippkaea orientalis (strain PCC 8801 / RF-1) TaxID=41431 RepID=B7K2R3_RIPO1|nr:CBS domain-containing protein [Rippkaea orientalis]ACK67614.1 CBS domain containing protein [Rippkaea orientalis PCC 8801]